MATTKSKSNNGTNRALAKRAAKKAPARRAARSGAGKAKKELSANELTLLAWKSTYANRHQRLD